MQTVWYHYKADAIPFGASLLFMNLGLETGDAATQDSAYPLSANNGNVSYL